MKEGGILNWQQLLRNGNVFFDNQDWNIAISHYEHAQSELEKEWQINTDSIELMQAWVSTQHNLATVYEVQSKLTRAANFLLTAHATIISRINNPDYSELAQSLALRMSSITYKSILEFNKKYAPQGINLNIHSLSINQSATMH